MIDSNEVIEVRRDTSANASDTLWLDVKRNFIPVKIVRTFKKIVKIEMTINHTIHAECGYSPSSWILKRCNSDGSIRQIHTCNIESMAINTQIDNAYFEAKIPAGTIFTSSEQSSREETYLVTNDGSSRLLSAKEKSGTYSDLIQADSTRNLSIFRIIIIVFAGLIAIVVAGTLLRIRKKKIA